MTTTIAKALEEIKHDWKWLHAVMVEAGCTGLCQTTVWYWWHGDFMPNREHAKVVEKILGCDICSPAQARMVQVEHEAQKHAKRFKTQEGACRRNER
jgi:hypothetical protein